ncbi:hypothetical protein SEUBUCD646_0B05680 [Saccharomyces eubayanus]|uniref:COMPASS (Complex proteins associated with Set1p) component n=2 Tax=Saccharomyces TaxID=4930 RepID=A0A6C1E358_SACPS|nr:hypothetical protein GRS66_006254 [Saccharomyces pastorianus]CAI1859798.1 hypothetical protein SEUBUCD650_0B05680 [Saccharomyces eubayanus]CAI1894095.1 hypothetical protein SEUBUCD646_0B05680 [Saccharomyces eubayanus]
MNGDENKNRYNEVATPIAGDASSKHGLKAEQNQGENNNNYSNRDNGITDINSNKNNNYNNSQTGSIPSFPTKGSKNVENTGNQNIKIEESSGSNLTMEESSDSKTSKLENVNLASTVGGSQTRKYLNANVTPHLLAGMRLIAVQQPDDPLRMLGEYLINQSEIQKSGENGNNVSV